jgi:large subunit ribosomal protein L4
MSETAAETTPVLAPVFNAEGEKVGELELPAAVFGQPVNRALLHQAVVRYLANQRVGTADTKTRAEVSGGGRKPWRQKGTGRARHGSIRSPIWRKGGVVFGPTPRSYRQDMPKRARRQALKSALSAKALDGEVLVLEGLSLAAPKTKVVAKLLTALGAEDALLVTADLDRVLVLSTRNLPKAEVMVAQDLNAYKVLRHDKLVLLREAVDRLTEVLG